MLSNKQGETAANGRGLHTMYRKFLVDNVVCSRRFHFTYDDESPTEKKVEIGCPFCGLTIFAADDHPAVKLARQENLVQTGTLSDRLIRECKGGGCAQCNNANKSSRK